MGFFKKEIKEIFRTSKLFIVPAVFLFFGFLSPITARYINELIAGMGGGIEIKLPEPTYLDSYAQFFKNFNFTCLVVMIFAFSGMVVDEKVKGSAILVLTKSVSRIQFIISKFLANLLLFTAAYAISALACVYYTYVLFPQFYNEGLLPALLTFWVLGTLILAVTVFASTIGKSYTVSVFIAFLIFIAVSFSSSIPGLDKYSPGALTGMPMEFLGGTMTAVEAGVPVAAALVLAVLFILGSVAVFRKQEL